MDAVSSPAAKPGHASINNLTNNFFTDTHIRTDDILLGGGLVGLNNNSQIANSETTYVELTNASGNIFGNGKGGNGDPWDITVTTKFSLRGGGIIGLNGLSNARADLKTLTNNVFAGIKVDVTDSYLKGGGIVGIQLNDNTNDKYDPSVDDPSVAAKLENASDNLFYAGQSRHLH